MGVSSAAACQHHPDREAIGICVRCRTRVCSECATKLQGINYCVACLGELAAQPAAPPTQRPLAGGRLVLAAGARVLVLWLLLWGLLEVGLPDTRWLP